MLPMLQCRRVYFGTTLRRDVAIVFAPSCVTMEWRSEKSGLYIEARLAASHMTSFDMYHGSAIPGINLADDDGDAILGCTSTGRPIQDFFAIGLRQKPPHLRSVDGFEPTDEGPRKYIVVVLEDDDALATFRHEAVPAVVWGGHVGWPAAPVLRSSAMARQFLEGVPIADAHAVLDAAEDAAALPHNFSRALRRSRVARSVVNVEAADTDNLNVVLREYGVRANEMRAAMTDDAKRDDFEEYVELIVARKVGLSHVEGPRGCLRAIERWPRISYYWPRIRRRTCSACGKHSLDLSQPRYLVCAGCSTGRGVGRYCSEACQAEHWPEHQKNCPTFHEAPVTIRALMYTK